MFSISDCYRFSLGCLGSAVYLALSDEETPYTTKTLLSGVYAVAFYALSYSIIKDPCVYRPPRLYPSDTEEFKTACGQAYERLKRERLIVPYSKVELEFFPHLESEMFDKYYKESLKGICFGLTAIFLRAMNNNPAATPTELASRHFNLEESIYLQLHRHIKNNHFQYTRNKYAEWFPEQDDLSFVFSWKEKIVVYSALQYKDIWIESFSKKILEGNSYVGRVGFRVNSISSHTFAIWRLRNQFGYFDNGSVYEFTDCNAFCNAVRNKILEYRRYYCQSNDFQKYEYFPIALYTKPNSINEELSL